MRKFSVKNGIYLTSDNSISKLNNNIFKCLLVLLLYNYSKYGIINFMQNKNIQTIKEITLLYAIPIIISIFVCIIINKFVKKNNKLLATSNLIPVFISLMFMVKDTPIMVASVISLILTILTMINIKNKTLDVNILALVLPSIWNIIARDNLTLDNPLYNLSSLNFIGTYQQIMGQYGSIIDYLVGNVYDLISPIILVVITIYLYYKNKIKIGIIASCLFSSFIMFSVIGIFNDMWSFYGLFNILMGNLFFVLIFVSSDSKNSPILMSSQVIYGIIIAIFLVVFRFIYAPLSITVAIVLSRLFVNVLDRVFINRKLVSFIYGILVVMLVVIPIGISYLL